LSEQASEEEYRKQNLALSIEHAILEASRTAISRPLNVPWLVTMLVMHGPLFLTDFRTHFVRTFTFASRNISSVTFDATFAS
jgi:hypothetical protein